MPRVILRRLLQAIPTLFGISLLSFGIMAAAPGGATAALRLDPRSTQQQREEIRQRMGVDDPLYVQYVRWLIGDDWLTYQIVHRDGSVTLEKGEQKGILRGDFGRSFSHKRPVLELIRDNVRPTAELGILSLIVGFGIGIPLGILSAIKAGGLFDNSTRVVAVIFSAIPTFWLGLLLLLLFGSMLGWLPMGNRCPITISGECTLADRVERLILPVFTLSTGAVAVLSRFTRSATLDVLTQDYVRTARAKGLHNASVWFSHATRNALLPVVTILGPAIPGILGGAVIVEKIFSWQGLGRLALDAVQQQDYPVVMAFVMFGGISTIIGYLISDIMYAMVDPRIRLG